MVNANAEIDLEETVNIEAASKGYTHLPQFDEIINFLCQTLAARRKQMLRLALERLPEHEICRLGLRGQIMLQDTAFETSEALRRQESHLTPLVCNVRPGSIYHSACISVNLARALLSVGFHNPNTDFRGFNPLMTADLCHLTRRRGLEGTVDLVSWFLDQGAELHSPIPVSGLEGFAAQSTAHLSGFKAIHRIADAFGEGIWNSSITADDHLRIGPMRHVINDVSADPCTCYCSLKGCTPPTLFIRALWRNYRWDEVGPRRTFARRMQRGIELMTIILSSDWDHNVAADIFRVITFQRLGMKHTCCKYKRDNWDAAIDSVTEAIVGGKYKVVEIMDPEEAAEIQEEDQYLAIRLEALVAEFTAKYKEQKVPFHDFFFGYWWQRMDEVEVEKDSDEAWTDDVGSIREIGVILDAER